ncbi:ABC-F family ATP-binding cassette domain-containing protein [Endomicrobium proavitum]|uniref:Putative ABC transporter duplicated ATPase component n=1 Tax=Endomicrobium proavitum TaxID=1408281 RepID=A0A0G3WI53_9BACT|nr:ATP-binding cassette domain-containing protein [Endomicrobium proavitum]AKL98371.1 putative ABC transporter duplicated ATPase component [Endomicrobium proavitum]
MQKPIFLNNVSLYFSGKICFENFSAQILPNSRIAVMGNNGAGKSSLLKIIKGDISPSEGEIVNNKNIVFGYVAQLVREYESLSGGEKFNKALSAAFAKHPDALLLDEPTNHLDLKNRQSLMKMLNFYKGTLIVVSHDEELLRNSVDTFWHIDNGQINIFNGKYDDYKNTVFQNRANLENQLHSLSKEKKENHKALMKEQQRAAKSKQRGEKFVEQKRWLPAVGDLKASSAQKSSGKNKEAINNKREYLNRQLSSIRIPEIIKPKFSLTAKDMGSKTIISISGAGAGYENKIILHNININVAAGQHLAVTGNNGSGKTTLFKAILNFDEIVKTGTWDAPAADDIGYLDQYYDGLDTEKTVFETIANLSPQKTYVETRDFLNDFLFRKNEEVNKKVDVLSGGEKARLSLAKIAVKTPKLLLIDEITNNIDLETKEHVTEVLKEYPGAMIIISHDTAFLEDIGVDYFYEVK